MPAPPMRKRTNRPPRRGQQGNECITPPGFGSGHYANTGHRGLIESCCHAQPCGTALGGPFGTSTIAPNLVQPAPKRPPALAWPYAKT